MAVRIESGYPINGYIETLIGGRTENQEGSSREHPLCGRTERGLYRR